ncbi:NAD-dependent epimerase/dehydratase family protein [Granulosicoccus antarcticus]|uniref:3 beta-hydroxysteroid dehydrogenase/Delta 5-->4-isomerase n=1 Tax=Granulosicoccus antarcticus IMCC3135 TaxID=1192854 RepID=A0A2Z2NTM4_9GAMM|nr:NAD-dependent epimerase/dehydratase family protein [Granulosicoccus antarcticus]ASJ74902.1 3 beta-hydroxysteroid dehydrogenase/Delta 5-->4-isomerase [Granulosicoccus antarcticus IMCC3135]
MKVLVTGATSLIGRHVVSRLLERGDQVTVLQRRPSGITGVSEVCCDIASSHDTATHSSGPGTESESANGKTTEDLLANAMESRDAVIHLAAKVSISGRWDAFEAINIKGTERLINTAKRCGVARFVHVSTPSVAHAGRSLIGAPAGQANPEQVHGHYARSKAIGEKIALAANGQAMKVVALRPHIVWGPGDTQLIKRIVDRARAGRLLLVGSALALIDTTYIDNAADAIVAGLDNTDRAAGHALVISNGQPRTVSEIMQRILIASGIDIPLRHVPAGVAITAGTVIEHIWQALNRQDDPPMTRFLAEQLATAHWFDQRETHRLLNWQPSIGIEEGFERLAAFEQAESNS